MASSAVVGLLRVLLTMDTGQFEAAAKKASDASKRWARDVGSIGQQATRIGQTLTAGLTLPIVGAAGAAIAAGVKFESAINSINGVLRPTAQQMERVRETAIKMGADTAFSATDAATAILELGKSGFDTDTAIASVGKTLELAAASGLSMGESASMAARTLSAFGLEASDLGHVNDVLAKAVNATSLEISDMQVAFGYVGPIARGFGMSIEEVSAALGIMRDRGIAAETTGRALREGMSRLANPVKSVEEVMSELGIASFESNGKLMGLTEVVGLLQGKGITAAQSLKLFGDAAGPGMYALIQNGQQGLIDLTNELENADGAAQAMADSMMTGLPGALERLKGSAETAWLAISKAIEPSVIRLADLAGGLADLVTTRLAPAFLALPQPVQTAALGLVGVAAAAGPLIWAFGGLASGAATLVGAFGKGGIAITAFGSVMRLTATHLPTLTAGVQAVSGALTLSTGVAGVMTGALRGLGYAAAYAAAAFVGWQIGTWIDQVTGASDAVGRLTARIGEFVGILPEGTVAQYDASIAAGKAAEAAKQAAGGLDTMAASAAALRERVAGKGLTAEVAALEAEIRRMTAAGEMTPGALQRIRSEVAMLQARGAELTAELLKYAPAVQGTVKPTDEAAEAAKRAREEFARLKDTISGEGALADAVNVVNAITQIGGAYKLTTEEATKYAAQLREVIEKSEAMGTKAPTALLNMAIQLDGIATAAKDAATGMQLLAENVERVTLQAAPLAATGISMSKFLEPFKQGIKGQGAAAGQGLGASLGNYVKTGLGPTILSAFQGGGNVGKSVGGGIGQILGEWAGKAAGPALSKLLGKGLGSALGSSLGPIGTMLGGFVGDKIGGLVGKLFGGGNSEKKQVKAALDDLLKKMPNLRAEAEKAGVSVDRLFNARTMADFNRELATVQAGLEAFAQQEQRNREQASGLFDEIMRAGSEGLPDAMRPAIDQLIALGLLTDEQAAKLKGLGSDKGIDVKQLESDLESIGGRMESLGPAFAQAKIDETSMRYANAIERMIKAGGDVGGILFDAREELGALAAESLATGRTLPENLRPWIEDLARSGNLIDKNGKKITDISGIKWGEKMETEGEKTARVWDQILAKITALVDRLAGPVNDTIDRVLRDREMNVDISFNERRDGQNHGDDPGFARGTMGRSGRWFQRFSPAGFATALHNTQAVINPSNALAFAADALAGRIPEIGGALGSSALAAAASSGASEAPSAGGVSILPIIFGSGEMSPYEIGRAAVRHLVESGLPTNADGITEAIESVLENYMRTYYQHG